MEFELIQKNDFAIRVDPPSAHVQERLKTITSEDQEQQTDDLPTEEHFFGYISPSASGNLLWELLVIITIYVFLIEIGFVIGFGSTFWLNQISSTNTIVLYLIILVILALDIILSFHRGFYKVGQGRVIQDKRQIQINYLKGYFAIDFITTLCVIIPLAVKFYASDILQLVFFLKLFKRGYYQQEIFREVQHKSGLRNALSISLLTIDALVIAHFCACFFIGIDLELYSVQYYQDNLNYTVNLFGGLWYIQYIYGQEYSSGTLSTLAPGPFPKNPIEVIYVIIVMLSFIILTSYIADGIVKIFFSESLRRVFHETNIQAFDNFLNLKEVSKSVKQRVQNYFELVWEVEGKVDLEFQKQAITKLSSKLRVELQQELFNIRRLSFLRYFGVRDDMDRMVLSSIEEIMTDAHEVIFQPSRITAERYLNVLAGGMVKYCIQYGRNSEALMSLSNNDKVIGAYEFITEQPYSYAAKTIHISHLHRLSQKVFFEIINSLDLKEQLMELQHKVLFSRQLELINKRCLLCMLFHLENQCPELFLSAHIHEQYASKQGSNTRKKHERKTPRRHREQFIDRTQLQNWTKDREAMIALEDLFPIHTFIQKLIKHEPVDAWANYTSYFPTHNVKNIFDD